MSYRVDIMWDPEAEVWIAQSEDIPGLALESGSFDALLTKVQYAAPELLELNKMQTSYPIHFVPTEFTREPYNG